MNLYTRAIHFKNGETLTITDGELTASKNAILKGHRWIVVQGELISADTIARIGSHHATAEMAVRDRASSERVLIMAGRGDVVDEQRRLEAQATARHYAITQAAVLENEPKTAATQKDALSWRDENGEIHYS